MLSKRSSLRKLKTVYKKSINYNCARNSLRTKSIHFVPNIKFLLYIIAHDAKSMDIAERWCRCMPFAKVLMIPTTVFFESIVYRDTLWSIRSEWKNLDFVGITTYKSLKFIAIEKLKAYLELGFYKPYDVMPLYGTGELLVRNSMYMK